MLWEERSGVIDNGSPFRQTGGMTSGAGTMEKRNVLSRIKERRACSRKLSEFRNRRRLVGGLEAAAPWKANGKVGMLVAIGHANALQTFFAPRALPATRASQLPRRTSFHLQAYG
jgi:hypothetical protein